MPRRDASTTGTTFLLLCVTDGHPGRHKKIDCTEFLFECDA
jgi:hypothetical protein